MEGDEEEDGADDLENEFNVHGDGRLMREFVLHGGNNQTSLNTDGIPLGSVPLLTYHEEVIDAKIFQHFFLSLSFSN